MKFQKFACKRIVFILYIYMEFEVKKCVEVT